MILNHIFNVDDVVPRGSDFVHVLFNLIFLKLGNQLLTSSLKLKKCFHGLFMIVFSCAYVSAVNYIAHNLQVLAFFAAVTAFFPQNRWLLFVCWSLRLWLLFALSLPLGVLVVCPEYIESLCRLEGKFGLWGRFVVFLAALCLWHEAARSSRVGGGGADHQKKTVWCSTFS